jgi:hypothetical protein
MNQKGHKVALSGSYGGSIENLLRNLHSTGVLQFSFVGRELTLQVKSEGLGKVMETLQKHGVENLTVLEWRKYGVTLAGSGAGCDEGSIVKVSLIPAALDEGIKPLAILQECKVSERLVGRCEEKVRAILADAGVTDALYTIQFNRKPKAGDYEKASQVAALNALFEAGGVINVE